MVNENIKFRQLLNIRNATFDKHVSPEDSENLYEYEAALSELLQVLGQSIMQKALSPSKIHQKKKEISTSFGKVTVSNDYPISKHESGFKMTPFFSRESSVCWSAKCV